MKRVVLALTALSWMAWGAQAASCGVFMDDLSTAIAGNLNMSGEMRASMLRMAHHAYDNCMVGNTKEADGTRDLIIKQLREHLGQR